MIGRSSVLFVIAALYASVWIGTVSIGAQASRLQTEPTATGTVAFQSASKEYLWYEAENMRGITETARHEPQLNPSYLEIPAVKAPGWSISGPGVSAEWSQGGESEWNSVAASSDATNGTIWQDGVRFEEVSLGYPEELKKHPDRPRMLRQILPPEPPGG